MSVFSKIRIDDKNNFTIQFLHFKSYVGIGIVDQTYKQLSNLYNKINLIRYDNNSTL